MTWQSRIKEAAYTSPGGQRMAFQYENVSVSFDKKGAAYDFPDADGTYMQDLGKSGRRLPLTVFFSGANCDLQADVFLAMLGEPGEGKLEHPVYGLINVLPFGEITRKDELVTRANQVSIELTFWETTGLVYPTVQGDAASAVQQAVSAYVQASAQQFAESAQLETPGALAGLIGDYRAALGTAREFLAPIAQASAEVQREFTAINRSIIETLDTLIGDPLVLALQTSLFVQEPSRAFARIESRLTAYSAMLDVLTGETAKPGFGSRNYNAFLAQDLFVLGASSGQVLSVLNNQFPTKSEAVAAADFLLTNLEKATVWRDASYQALDEIDTGLAYAQIQQAVALAAGYLVEISFTLRQERVVFLNRPRALIELVAELYGDVDENLDFFISSNDLTGDEILELPRGRRVAYYV